MDRKDDFRFEVANLITEVRYHYKLTQVQLAKKMKTQQPSIARVESGNILPSLSFLERLADSLGTYLIAPKFGFMEEQIKNFTHNINTHSSSRAQILNTHNGIQISFIQTSYFEHWPDVLVMR